jgi:hypothetical protein
MTIYESCIRGHRPAINITSPSAILPVRKHYVIIAVNVKTSAFFWLGVDLYIGTCIPKYTASYNVRS